MLPREIFEILHAVMAIFVLFEHVSGKFCLNFLILILSASPNTVHFVRTFSIVVQFVPFEYALGAMSLVNDQIKAMVEGVLRVCIPPA